MFPARLQAAARGVERGQLAHGIRRRETGRHEILIEIRLVKVALHGDHVRGRWRPVQPEPALADTPVVAGVAAIGRNQAVAFPESPINAVLRVIAQLAAVANSGDGPFLVAGGQRHQSALSIPGVLGDDVDDAVDGVGAPQAAAGTPDYLDAFDVVQRQVLDFPMHAGEQRGIDRAPVDQHQQLVGEAAAEAANGDGPAAGVDAGGLHAGREPQRLRHAGRPRPADVVGGDDEHRRRRVLQGLRQLRRRNHLDVHQFLDAEPGQIGRVRPRRAGCNRYAGQRRQGDRRRPRSLRGSRRPRLFIGAIQVHFSTVNFRNAKISHHNKNCTETLVFVLNPCKASGPRSLLPWSQPLDAYRRTSTATDSICAVWGNMSSTPALSRR